MSRSLVRLAGICGVTTLAAMEAGCSDIPRASTEGNVAAGAEANGGAGGKMLGVGGAGAGSPSIAGNITGAGGGVTSAGGGIGGTSNAAGTPGADPLSTDESSFFGTSRCSTAQAFCDGFELPNVDGQSWDEQGNAAISIDTAEKARGSSSLHIRTQGNGHGFLRLTKIFPALSARYYARMFIRFNDLPSAPTWAHWTFAESAGTGDGSLVRVGGQLDQKMNRFGVGSDQGPTGDWTSLDTDPGGNPQAPPTKKWVCVEWLHDGSANETKFWSGGVEHPSLASTSSDHGGKNVAFDVPSLESVWVGWWLYQSGSVPNQFDVWIDEVAFDDERIGCAG